MSYEKTWSFSINTVPTDQSTATKQMQSFVLQLKQFLVTSAGWTVVFSSNGSVANTSDNWNSLTDIAMPNANITLKSPTGFIAGTNGSYTGTQSCVWLTISMSASVSNLGTLSLHNTAPTGGSTTTVQSSTTQISFSGPQCLSGSPIPSYFHFACTSTGMFWVSISPCSNVNRSVTYFLCVAQTSGAPSNYAGLDYPYNCCIWTNYSSSTTGAAVVTGLAAWNYHGVATFNILQGNTGMASQFNGALFTNLYTKDNWGTSKWNVGKIYPLITTSGSPNALGYIPDIWWTFNPPIAGIFIDNLASPQWMLTSWLILPSNSCIRI